MANRSGSTSKTGSATRGTEEPRPPRRWLRRLLCAVVLAGAVVGGLIWWQERTLSQAAAALERNEPKYALYLTNAFLERRPEHSRAMAIQARALVQLGYPDDAIAIFDQVGAATPEDLHAWARAFMMREEWTAGLRLLIRVREMLPENADAMYEIASCYLRLGMFDRALENARRFVSQPGQAARGYVLIGSIHGDMRHDREAAAAFEKVLAEEPDARNLQIPPAEFFLRYGRVLMRTGEPEKALAPLKRSVADAESGEAFVLLGDAASQMGQPGKAVTAWKKALTLDPQSHAARAGLANAALLEKNGPQALEWLQPLAEDKHLSSRIAYLFQRTHQLLGGEEEAARWKTRTDALRKEETTLAALENALISQPQSFWSRVVRAHRFASEGNWTQAELSIATLVEEAPGEPYVIALAGAIRRKGELPPLTRIPVTQF